MSCRQQNGLTFSINHKIQREWFDGVGPLEQCRTYEMEEEWSTMFQPGTHQDLKHPLYATAEQGAIFNS